MIFLMLSVVARLGLDHVPAVSILEGAIAYALADFFRIKYASDGLPTCTDRLQQWNRPRGRKIELIPVEHLGDRRRELLPSKIREKGSQMVRHPQYREIDTMLHLKIFNVT